MKRKATVLIVGSVLLCGLAAFVWVSRGEGGRDITVIGPDNQKGQPARGEAAAILPSPVSGEARLSDAAPIGSVMAWLKSYTNTPGLPRGWVECNGQRLDLPDSPYHGQTIPNLNGAGSQPKRFLRGSTESGAAGGAEAHNHGVILMDRSGQRQANVSSKDPASNLPPYYEVTWIMKVL